MRAQYSPPFVLALCLAAGVGLPAMATSLQAVEAVDASNLQSWPLEVVAPTGPAFTLMPPEHTGLLFTNELRADAEANNHNLLNGSGLALGDFDGDGWVDVFLCNLNGRSALFRNLGGWRFADVSSQAGVELVNFEARGAVFADVDGDGDLDLLVSGSGKGVRLFLNEGQGRFVDARRTELEARTGSTSMALGDIDGDGDLDLYVANYGENTIRSGMQIATRVLGGREQVVGRYRNRLKIIEGRLVEYGEPDVLYLNDGRGGFSPVSWTGGAFRDEQNQPLTAAPWELGFSVALRDINQDGHPDLYVCNDFQDPDRLWLGDGRGGFRLIAREALRSTCHFSMTVDFADVNRDGLDDFVVTDMVSRFHHLRMMQLSPSTPPIIHTLERDADRPQYRRNMLFLNRGDGTYAEIGQYAGLAASDWSWSAVFLDADLDGFDDLFIGNGHYYDTQDLDAIERSRVLSPAERRDGRALLNLFPLLRTPNMAFHNQGDLRFEEVGAAWGFSSLDVSHSIARGDLDNDGDLDLVVNCLRAPARVYRNNAAGPRLAVRLKGLPPNTAGIGSRIRLSRTSLPDQETEMTLGGHYLASDPAQRVFALGSTDDRPTLTVTWRSGRRSVVHGLQPNRLYEVEESTAAAPTPRPPRSATPSPTWFQDRSDLLDYRHAEDPWDDFSLQPSLPKALSRGGPALAWFDLDGDGHEDLIVGASRGNAPALFRNHSGGRLSLVAGAFPQSLTDDTAGVVGWAPLPGQRQVLTGIARVTPATAPTPAGLAWTMGPGGIQPPIAFGAGGASAGPLALGDIEGDGSLEVFLGGRFVPGRYPEPAGSLLLRMRSGQLEPDPAASKLLARLGLVTAALFSDLDGDGLPELIVAREWGTIEIFSFVQGQPRRADPQWQLPPWTGLWTSLATADFDGDGRLDIVAGNWGLNSAYQQTAPGPHRLYYGDFHSHGGVQILEAYRENGTGRLRPLRDMTTVERHLPWVRARFPTHRAFAHAEIAEILGDRLAQAQSLEIAHLPSMLFLRRDNHWEARPLPPEAQWSPVMGIVAADFNADGHEDLFLSQNFFAVRPEDARLDAGRGLLLEGDGRGGFRSLTGQESGILIYGEQRACAAADYDGDGRTDLVVAQNKGPVRLLHNVSARTGLRVRLEGPPANPTGIGARIRVVYADGTYGPAREIQAGSGFWSQNGATQVLGLAREPAALRLVWPGGQTQTVTVTPHDRNLVVPFPLGD